MRGVAIRMTQDELKKVYLRMLWIIPGMLLAMVGDYCMGIEPKDSVAISGMISSGRYSLLYYCRTAFCVFFENAAPRL